MQTININNYATQIGGISTAGDTIVNDLSTGKQYQYTLGAWKEYQVPAGSISDVRVVDSPYVIEPIDNICRISANTGLAVANATYGRLFTASYTGKITSIQVLNSVGVGSIQASIYTTAGNLVAKTALTTASAGIQTLTLNQDAVGAATTGYAITGGGLYVIALAATSVSNLFSGFSGQPTFSITGPAAQYYSASTTPATLTANASNQAFAPWSALLCS
jgi:hypothetical protein